MLNKNERYEWDLKAKKINRLPPIPSGGSFQAAAERIEQEKSQAARRGVFKRKEEK